MNKVRKVNRATAVRKGPSASRVLWAHKDRSEVKANKGLKELMELAAHTIMGNDLLKAEVTLTDKWSK